LLNHLFNQQQLGDRSHQLEQQQQQQQQQQQPASQPASIKKNFLKNFSLLKEKHF